MRQLERFIVLNAIDQRWREHLDNMDYLREGIHLRSMAQKDPLVEYKVEGHQMFQEMMAQVRAEVCSFLFHADIAVEEDLGPDAQPQGGQLNYMHGDHSALEDAREYGAPSAEQLVHDLHAGPAGRLGVADADRPASRERRAGAQRPVPMRLGQEVQALPRRAGSGLDGRAEHARRARGGDPGAPGPACLGP